MLVLENLKCALICVLSLLTASSFALGELHDEPTRFDQGLRGDITAVTFGKPTTVTVLLEVQEVLINLDVSSEAKVWTAYEPGQIADLKEGRFVSLRLAEDHRTVTEIHLEGETKLAVIKSIEASGKWTVAEFDDDEKEGPPKEVDLVADAVFRIGVFPARRDEFKPEMKITLEYGRSGKQVHAIQAQIVEGSTAVGEVTEINAKTNMIKIDREAAEQVLPGPASFTVSPTTIIWLDSQTAKLADLKPGFGVALRLADDGKTVLALRAARPDPDDDDAKLEKDGEKKRDK